MTQQQPTPSRSPPKGSPSNADKDAARKDGVKPKRSEPVDASHTDDADNAISGEHSSTKNLETEPDRVGK